MKYSILSEPQYKLDNLKITTIDSTYIQLIRLWRNQQIDILRQNQILSEERQEQYFKNNVFSLYDSDTPEQVLFNCFYDDRFIGYGGIVHISHANKIGEISFLLDPQIKTDGFYESVFVNFIKLMDTIAFQEIGLNKLFTETFSRRMAHIPMLEKAGYLCEGIRRSHLIINGELTDIYLHGKLSNTISL